MITHSISLPRRIAGVVRPGGITPPVVSDGDRVGAIFVEQAVILVAINGVVLEAGLRVIEQPYPGLIGRYRRVVDRGGGSVEPDSAPIVATTVAAIIIITTTLVVVATIGDEGILDQVLSIN